MDRRQFLSSSAGAALIPALPSWLANAGTLANRASGDERILITIHLHGGNDGLNTVVPWCDDAYARSRTALRLKKKELLSLDDATGLHPSLRWLHERIENGHAAIVRGVGYPRPDRSHFNSMDIWFAGRRDDEDRDGTGWIGRALDRSQPQSASRAAAAMFVGEGVPPVALRGTRAQALSLAGPEDLALHSSTDFAAAIGADSNTELEAFASQRFQDAYGFAKRLADLNTRDGAMAAYPATNLGQRLRTIAQLLKLEVPNRVFFTQQGGYDTHAKQLDAHSRLLRGLDRSLRAFWADLEALELTDRVLVFVFSEFGRTLSENASGGTDHGTAGPVFLLGPNMTAPLVGAPPSLSELELGEPIPTVDYRRVYATILDGWFRVPSTPVIGAGFDRVECFR